MGSAGGRNDPANLSFLDYGLINSNETAIKGY